MFFCNRCLLWKEERAVVDGGADALARLAHGEVGQADDGDRRVPVGLAPRGRQVNFNIDEVCVVDVILRKFVFV